MAIAPEDIFDTLDGGSTSQLTRVPIDRIQCYEHNPRQAANPEYQRIKDSIREQGIDQPLVITQRPGETDFVTYAGGNTRLHILKALYEETEEERYFYAPCAFKPWRHESDVLLAHLRENDLRGSLTFIDKAQAIVQVKDMLEEELEGEALSQRDLQTLLSARGYQLSQTMISHSIYAVGHLLPQMPRALEAGVGRRQIERLRTLEQASGQLWAHYRIGSEAEFSEVFATLCQRNDSPDWEPELLRIALETELAEAADTDIHRIRLELDELQAGRTLDPPPAPVDPVVPMLDVEGVDNIADDGNREPSPNPEAIEANHEDSATIGAHRQRMIHNDLKSLRARAWTLASRLAQRNGMAALIKPDMGRGVGYMVKDVPDAALVNQLDPHLHQRVCALWWQLADCADLLNAPLNRILERLEEHSRLKVLLLEQRHDKIEHLIEAPAPGRMGQRLWHPLGDADWQDYLSLLDTYRHIHRLAEDHQHTLWE